MRGVRVQEAVLDRKPVQGCGVVAGPDHVGAGDRRVLDASAAARAALDGDVGVGGTEVVEDAQVAGDVLGVEIDAPAPGRPRSVGGRFMSHLR